VVVAMVGQWWLTLKVYRIGSDPATFKRYQLIPFH
jgi:hypothetical protein